MMKPIPDTDPKSEQEKTNQEKSEFLKHLKTASIAVNNWPEWMKGEYINVFNRSESKSEGNSE